MTNPTQRRRAGKPGKANPDMPEGAVMDCVSEIARAIDASPAMHARTASKPNTRLFLECLIVECEERLDCLDFGGSE